MVSKISDLIMFANESDLMKSQRDLLLKYQNLLNF